MVKKQIKVVPYDPSWPSFFQEESKKIHQVLGDNCLAVHHVGSTSVPGLSAKPKIDILVVVKSPTACKEALETIGIVYKGEYNIPGHYGFNKRGGVELNVHLYQEGHAEIALNLLFRDYLRSHPDICKEYAELKKALLQDEASYEKKQSLFTGYNLGKDGFIRKVLGDAGFRQIRILKCTHYEEQKAIKALREKFSKETSIRALEGHTEQEIDLVLYQGVKIIGYMHVLFPQKGKAAIHDLILLPDYREKGLEKGFQDLFDQWQNLPKYDKNS